MSIMSEQICSTAMKDSLLHAAAACGAVEAVQQLLLMNVDINYKELGLGLTPLHVAVGANQYEIVQILLQWKVKINEYAKDNLTALHIAVLNKSPSMVKLLLDHGVCVNPERKFRGKTPLHLAVEHNCYEISELLLIKGACINDATFGGTTLFDVAQSIGNNKLTLLVLEYARIRHIVYKAYSQCNPTSEHEPRRTLERLETVCDKKQQSLLKKTLKRTHLRKCLLSDKQSNCNADGVN